MKIMGIAPGQRVHHRRTFHHFCLSLIQTGHLVELVAHDDDQVNDTNIKIHDLGNLQVTLRWNLLKRLARNFKAYFTAIRAKADLYIVFTPEFIPFAVLLKWASGKPVIFDCKEDFIGYAQQRAGIPNAVRNLLVFLIRQVLRFAARHLDYITVADLGTEKQFQEHTLKVRTIFNFPDLKLFPLALANNTNTPEFDLVYHGNLPRIFLNQMLKIDQQLLLMGKKVTWYLFGRSPEVDWFREELKRLNVDERFFYRLEEFIPVKQVPYEVKRARIGIIPLPSLPKFLNNIPHKLFEYMALGMPVILSDLPPSRPFVEGKGVGILVDSNDYAAYAKAVITLLDDPNTCQTMGRCGRQLVEQTYNWETESRKLIELIEILTKK